MEDNEFSLDVDSLGECRIPSPMTGIKFVGQEDHVLYFSNMRYIQKFIDLIKAPPQPNSISSGCGPMAKTFILLHVSQNHIMLLPLYSCRRRTSPYKGPSCTSKSAPQYLRASWPLVEQQIYD